jgi:hypothetical protein
MRTGLTALLLCFVALFSAPMAFAEDSPDATAVEASLAPPPPAAAMPDVPEAAPDPATPAVPEIVAPAEPAPSTAPSTWSALGWQLAGYVVPVLGALLTALVGFGIRWLTTKTSNLRVHAVLNHVDDLITSAVAAVQQQTVDALKKAAEGGGLTDDQQVQAFNAALAAVRTILGTKGLAALQAALGAGQESVVQYLESKIEAAVAARKAATS